jgi:hypothetical protein
VHSTVSGQQPGSYLQYRGAASAQPAHSLQLVLDRLAAALQEQLEEGERQLGDRWLKGILRSPVHSRGSAKDSFPAAVLAADAEYFATAAASASARSGSAGGSSSSSASSRAVKQHQYLGHIRCIDAQAYPFDKRSVMLSQACLTTNAMCVALRCMVTCLPWRQLAAVAGGSAVHYRLIPRLL